MPATIFFFVHMLFHVSNPFSASSGIGLGSGHCRECCGVEGPCSGHS